MPRRRAAGHIDALEPAHGLVAGGDAPDVSQRDGLGEAGAATAPAAKRAAPRFNKHEMAWLTERFEANGGVLGKTVGYAAHKKATADLAGASAYWACEISFGAVLICVILLEFIASFHAAHNCHRNKRQCTGV